MRRGEIWWADLPAATGSEPGFRRPFVIVSDDDFNASRIDTVVVVGLTSNLRRADAPGNVLVPSHRSGLPRDSVANVSQIVTLDKADLVEKIGRVPSELLEEIEAGLRLVLAL